ncbi:neural/ectodermal development factor IMP-L2-like [Anopheles albimanus]|uniref:Ig-like domain-containing protein n=1 Tax=Anopheles albimanus TaxID=7167 RepID=A0A182FQU3_ANOAL|nr:neural/ectodermal development factor IMP-L2-like [Anopheles albimanus]XP_035780953.1 neural/ectodermal development factor IMP-L2-like [Anopheles albimanus]XP_035780954.1 neural/ectodermal development factor IMP-L2-like [Anopheles albimanus]XP_035780955.1 neural/ectodermal development factor IMP-L2-like [Anopheles albimanus]XP_035780956.1 neural/ectodermal development factor IMP-L2-like [Anopheles albimanus]
MNRDHLFIVVVMALALAMLTGHCSGRAVELDADGSSIAAASDAAGAPSAASSLGIRAAEPGRAARPTFVKITTPPPARVAQIRGTTVELECEIVGSPTPSVQWVHGSGQTADWEDISVNVITEETPTSVARVVSRLVIDRSSRASQATYTCIGRSAGQLAMASTVVYHIDATGSRLGNFSDLMLLRPVGAGATSPTHSFMNLKNARITLHYKTLFENMGSTVVLPCKAVGRPVPEITWLNEDGSVVGSLQDPRLRTLPTGELIITGLRWTDMGTYTCVAKNAISKDEAETFIYPVRPN